MFVLKNVRSFLYKDKRFGPSILLFPLLIFFLIILSHNSIDFKINPSSYLSMHIILELFSIVISLSIALQSWHLCIYNPSRRGLFIGALFLGLGVIDLLHTLTYKGMPFFSITTTGAHATWFWVTARFSEALLLLLIIGMPDKKSSYKSKIVLFLTCFLSTLLVSYLILFKIDYLPPLLDSRGMITPLKISLEYGIALLHLLTILLIFRRGQAQDLESSNTGYVTLYTLIALSFLFLGELLFTLYQTVYDLENLFGHIYKCLGYFFIYKGILVESIREPFIREQDAHQKSEHYREELEQFFHLSLDALVITDLRGRLYGWNPTFQRILGYENAEELSGKMIQNLVYPQDHQQALLALKELESGKELSYYENRYLGKDGIIHWFAWSALPMTHKGLIYAVGKEITERKKTESEMARFERLNLVAEMAAAISHEVRNPMTTVRGFLQILQAKEHDLVNQEYFQLMIEELDRANAIITEFLSLGKNKTVNFMHLNLNDVIMALAPLIEADALGQDKNIKFELSPIPKLVLDEKEIRQILLNLTRNGLEAMQSGGLIRIKTFVQNTKVILAVQDQGSGIPGAVLEKLGTPFLTTKENGTGLGLATCFSIASRHQAKIHIETGNAGTTFFVEFDPHAKEFNDTIVS